MILFCVVALQKRQVYKMTYTSPTLKRVVKTKLCTGCGLCSALTAEGKIDIQMSEAGLLRPVQKSSLSSEEENLIAETCPGLNIIQHSYADYDHAIWGPVVRLYTGYATDSDLRHHASSGGAISALLNYLLEAGHIDFVVQNAADNKAPLQNKVFESFNKTDVFKAAGSRYAPSAPLSYLREQLEKPGRFAFVGKPCDVAALRHLATKDERINEKIPYFFSFFCAGIPSTNGAKKILEKLNVAEKDVKRFRYRGDGWPGFAVAHQNDGREARMSYHDSWGKILSKHVQFRCKICPDGIGGAADIVCADAWHCDEQGYPLFNEEAGRSLIVIRTAKGQTVLQNAVKEGFVNITPFDINEIEKFQPSQARRKKLILSRLLAMALIKKDWPRFKGLQLFKSAKQIDLFQNLKSFLGMVRRVRKIRSQEYF